jgi:hypothetical protein
MAVASCAANRQTLAVLPAERPSLLVQLDSWVAPFSAISKICFPAGWLASAGLC